MDAAGEPTGTQQPSTSGLGGAANQRDVHAAPEIKPHVEPLKRHPSMNPDYPDAVTPLESSKRRCTGGSSFRRGRASGEDADALMLPVPSPGLLEPATPFFTVASSSTAAHSGMESGMPPKEEEPLPQTTPPPPAACSAFNLAGLLEHHFDAAAIVGSAAHGADGSASECAAEPLNTVQKAMQGKSYVSDVVGRKPVVERAIVEQRAQELQQLVDDRIQQTSPSQGGPCLAFGKDGVPQQPEASGGVPGSWLVLQGSPLTGVGQGYSNIGHLDHSTSVDKWAQTDNMVEPNPLGVPASQASSKNSNAIHAQLQWRMSDIPPERAGRVPPLRLPPQLPMPSPQHYFNTAPIAQVDGIMTDDAVQVAAAASAHYGRRHTQDTCPASVRTVQSGTGPAPGRADAAVPLHLKLKEVNEAKRRIDEKKTQQQKRGRAAAGAPAAVPACRGSAGGGHAQAPKTASNYQRLLQESQRRTAITARTRPPGLGIRVMGTQPAAAPVRTTAMYGAPQPGQAHPAAAAPMHAADEKSTSAYSQMAFLAEDNVAFIHAAAPPQPPIKAPTLQPNQPGAKESFAAYPSSHSPQELQVYSLHEAVMPCQTHLTPALLAAAAAAARTSQPIQTAFNLSDLLKATSTAPPQQATAGAAERRCADGKHGPAAGAAGAKGMEPTGFVLVSRRGTRESFGADQAMSSLLHLDSLLPPPAWRDASTTSNLNNNSSNGNGRNSNANNNNNSGNLNNGNSHSGAAATEAAGVAGPCGAVNEGTAAIAPPPAAPAASMQAQRAAVVRVPSSAMGHFDLWLEDAATAGAPPGVDASSCASPTPIGTAGWAGEGLQTRVTLASREQIKQGSPVRPRYGSGVNDPPAVSRGTSAAPRAPPTGKKGSAAGPLTSGGTRSQSAPQGGRKSARKACADVGRASGRLPSAGAGSSAACTATAQALVQPAVRLTEAAARPAAVGPAPRITNSADGLAESEHSSDSESAAAPSLSTPLPPPRVISTCAAAGAEDLHATTPGAPAAVWGTPVAGAPMSPVDASGAITSPRVRFGAAEDMPLAAAAQHARVTSPPRVFMGGAATVASPVRRSPPQRPNAAKHLAEAVEGGPAMVATERRVSDQSAAPSSPRNFHHYAQPRQQPTQQPISDYIGMGPDAILQKLLRRGLPMANHGPIKPRSTPGPAHSSGGRRPSSNPRLSHAGSGRLSGAGARHTSGTPPQAPRIPASPGQAQLPPRASPPGVSLGAQRRDGITAHNPNIHSPARDYPKPWTVNAVARASPPPHLAGFHRPHHVALHQAVSLGQGKSPQHAAFNSNADCSSGRHSAGAEREAQHAGSCATVEGTKMESGDALHPTLLTVLPAPIAAAPSARLSPGARQGAVALGQASFIATQGPHDFGAVLSPCGSLAPRVLFDAQPAPAVHCASPARESVLHSGGANPIPTSPRHPVNRMSATRASHNSTPHHSPSGYTNIHNMRLMARHQPSRSYGAVSPPDVRASTDRSLGAAATTARARANNDIDAVLRSSDPGPVTPRAPMPTTVDAATSPQILPNLFAAVGAAAAAAGSGSDLEEQASSMCRQGNSMPASSRRSTRPQQLTTSTPAVDVAVVAPPQSPAPSAAPVPGTAGLQPADPDTQLPLSPESPAGIGCCGYRLMRERPKPKLHAANSNRLWRSSGSGRDARAT